ncbi:MAG: putative membrane protein, partial [Porphyrobacter sp. HL-46]
ALVAHAVWTGGRADERAQVERARAELAALDTTRQTAQQIRREAGREAEAAQAELNDFAQAMRGATLAELQARRRATQDALTRLSQTLPSRFEQNRQIVTGDTAALAAGVLARIEIAKLERQLAFLKESIAIAQGNRPARVLLEKLKGELRAAATTLQAAEANCTSATKALQAFDDKWFGARWIAGGRRERRVLASEKTAACLTRDAAQEAHNALAAAIASTSLALNAGEATIDTAVIAATDAIDELERNSAERRQQLAARMEDASGGITGLAERYQLARQARGALLILLGIIAMPFVIRALFYYVVAPFAERRNAIRIALPGIGDSPLPAAEPSRISIPVTLEPGEELLIRQDYLQSSPIDAKKATRWLLDVGHSLSSIASGLFFLTRISGSGSTTVSAVKDPFAELAQITLPRGASCVLHPRALVALVQPVGETMWITSHWRLFSLNAWLTMQLRFMAFHGPARLIVKGGRGVRIEPAQAGRIFGQDQLIGFSADLVYSVTRTETFAPYLFGREQLFKDKVEQGSGILVIEEAPFAGRAAGEVRRGLEGALDAGMKAFGL